MQVAGLALAYGLHQFHGNTNYVSSYACDRWFTVFLLLLLFFVVVVVAVVVVVVTMTQVSCCLKLLHMAMLSNLLLICGKLRVNDDSLANYRKCWGEGQEPEKVLICTARCLHVQDLNAKQGVLCLQTIRGRSVSITTKEKSWLHSAGMDWKVVIYFKKK